MSDIIDVDYSVIQSEDETKEIEQQPAGKSGIEERRAKVFNMVSNGIKRTVIAKILGVSLRTVQRDLATIQDQNRMRLEKLVPSLSIAETISYYEAIRDKALLEYNAASSPSAKNMFLNTASRMLENVNKLLMSCGVLPSVPRGGGVNVQVNVGEKYARESRGMTIDEMKAERGRIERELQDIHNEGETT